MPSLVAASRRAAAVGGGNMWMASIAAGGAAAVDCDRHALDLPRSRRTEEQRELGDVFRRRDVARPAARHDLLADFLHGGAGGLRALRPQLLGALGLGGAGVNHVDVHVVALAELR